MYRTKIVEQKMPNKSNVLYTYNIRKIKVYESEGNSNDIAINSSFDDAIEEQVNV